MMRVVSRAQASLAIITGVLIAAAALSADMVSTCDRSASGLARDTVVADIEALTTGLVQFQGLVGRYHSTTGGRFREEIRQRFQTVRGQLAALEAGHADRIAGDPTVLSALLNLDKSVQGLDPLVRDLDRPDAGAGIVGATRDMQGWLGRIASFAANDLVGSLAVAGAARASALHRLFWLASLAALSCLGLVAMLLDSNRRLHALARRDVLTGLQNRLTFSETLAAVLKDPGPGNEVALMLLDVDLFKDINDTLGHAAGDLILKEIARRFARLVTNGIHVSRLGGDEFAMVVTAPQAHRAARDMVEKIMRSLVKPFDLGSKSIAVSMSIGVALTPLDWCDAETMLRNADIALYASKAAGRGTFRIFSVKMDSDFRDRRSMEDDLRRAVRDGGFEVHFQPVVDLATHAIVSCEALARWNRAGHGYVPPMTFITLAEEIGLIQEIGDWVLAEACRAVRTWPPDVRLAINLSPHQFDGGGIVGSVSRVLNETGVPPDRVEFEITESLLLRDSEAVQRALIDLRAMGVQIALDDFGTGYSSLGYLQRFPIDRIKIDQSFVRDMTRSPEATAIVESICLLAAKLNIATTGEGIETEAHAALLRSLGCTQGQGYLFDRPMTAEACSMRLDSQRRPAAAA